MKKLVILCCVLLLLAACGKFDDANMKDQYYVYLEDQQTGQPVSDQVLFTQFYNGTAMCGFKQLNPDDGCGQGSDDTTQKCHEDVCYKMVEAVFNTQMDALKAQIAADAAAANATVPAAVQPPPVTPSGNTS